jgi:hypothetical protein
MAGLMDFMMNPVGGLGAGQQAGGLGGFQDLAGALGPALMVPQAQRGAVFGIGAARAGEQREMRQTQNATAQFLIQRGIAKDPEEAMALVQQPELMRFILKDGGTEFTQRAEAAAQYGLTPEDPRYQSFVLGMDDPSGGGAAETWGLTPIPGEGPNQESLLGVTSNRGNFKTVQTDGFTPLSPFEKRYQQAYGGGLAKDQQGAAFDLPRIERNAQQSIAVLEKMKTHPGRAGSTGFLQGALPARTSDQVDFNSLVDQTKGQAFLEAYNALRGGGQITDIEGAKAENALSRLRNQRLSDDDYKQAIQDFEEVIMHGLEVARQQAVSTLPVPGQTIPGGGNTRLRFNPQTGELE